MPRPPVEVRRGTVADVEELMTLWALARQELDRGDRFVGPAPETLRPRLLESLADGSVQVHLADVDGRAAGYVVSRLAPMSVLSDARLLQVDHLWVTQSMRRRGVARALLTACVGLAEREGAERVVSSVSPTARETHRFYARLGFAPIVVRRMSSTAALRRRLTGPSRQPALQEVLNRRRSLRDRARAGTAG